MVHVTWIWKIRLTADMEPDSHNQGYWERENLVLPHLIINLLHRCDWWNMIYSDSYFYDKWSFDTIS